MHNEFKIALFTFISLVSANSFSQSRYNLIYEKSLGMNSGAENIASGHYLWQNFDNHFIPKKISANSKVANVGFRLGKLFLLDYPIAFILPSIQHEKFGHGSRVMEFDGTIKKINITLPPPFQSDLPYISYRYDKETTLQQDAMITAGGSEANAILGDILRKNILLDDELDYHNALLYLYANNDLSGYAAFAANISGSDITSYVDNINAFYPENNLKVKKLRLYGLLSIVLDPLNYYAFNSLFNGYVWQGKSKSKIHFIKLNDNTKYLPKLKFGLTPYGPELALQNYFKNNQKLYTLSLGFSDGTFEKSWRIVAETWNIQLKNKFFFNISSQIWNQPKIEFYNNDILESSENFGALLVATTNYDILSKDNKIGLTLQMGYKSKGFAFGEALNSGLILKVGLSFKFKPTI